MDEEPKDHYAQQLFHQIFFAGVVKSSPEKERGKAE